MNRLELTVLPIEKMSILHAIRISKIPCNGYFPIIGDILYKRNLTEYTHEQHSSQGTQFVDEFDIRVLQAVQKIYPEAKGSQKLIMFDSEEEYIGNRLKFPKQEIWFSIYPELSMANVAELVGKSFFGYRFSMNIFAEWGDVKIFKNDFFSINYDFSQEEDIKKMIDTVTYNPL